MKSTTGLDPVRTKQGGERAWVVAMLVAVLVSSLQLGIGPARAQTTAPSPPVPPSSFPSAAPTTTSPSPAPPRPSSFPPVARSLGDAPPAVDAHPPGLSMIGPVPVAAPGEELTDRRTSTSKTFVGDAPGEFRTEIYAQPINYKDERGHWTRIDPSLGAATNGRRVSKANATTVDLAEQADDDAVGRLRLDAGTSVGFALEGAAKVKAKAEADSMTYTAIRRDSDLRLTSQGGGLKEEIVLRSSSAPSTFVFPLQLQGLTASIDGRGDVVYRDKAGAERPRTPHGYMVDSSADPRAGGEGKVSTGVTYRLVPRGMGVALEVSLDRRWLVSPERVWPVTVDPSLSAYVPNSSGDTYVMQGAHNNFSTEADLKLGTFDGGTSKDRVFLNFPGVTALAGKTINSAALKLYENHSWSCDARPVEVYRVTAPWNGTDLWDFPGAPTGEWVTTSSFAYCGGGWASFDVRTAVANWASGAWGPNGLMLKAGDEGDNYNWKKVQLL